MDNKLFDHIEQQMKTAANSWEPAFDEKAWEDMERRLDGENDRKRPLAWWSWLLPLLLLLVAGGYFLLEKNINSKEINLPGNKIASALPETSKGIASGNEKKGADKTADPLPLLKINYPPSKTRYKSVVTSREAPAGKEEDTFPKNNMTVYEKGKMTMKVLAGQADEDDNEEMMTEEKQRTDRQQEETTPMQNQDAPISTEEEKKTPSDPEKIIDTAAKEKTRADDKKERQPSKFYFSVAGGIEGNGVDFPGTNRFGTRTGFLTGYQLTKKLSIQTGFFAGNKKYVAGKGAYKAKEGYWATVDITKVDADCRVYEIPLALRYDFTPSAKWNSFAVAGLSSYIMDKEDYAYDYIRFGNPYHAKASYKGNQHFLSVLRLSGGIERKISPQFSLGVNPGLAIPLAGVGEGQIKLFSTELLLSLKYRPFKRSR